MTRWHPLRGRIPAKRGPCSALRVATIRYGDYVEQLTYLLFLKMADERTRPRYNQEELDKQKGLLGLIFTKSHGYLT